jgi:hypothetical protein
MPTVNHRRLLVLAWLNVLIHLAGLAMAALGMRPGTPLVDVVERLDFLAATPLGWTLGWGVWMVCTAALVAFVTELVRYLPDHLGLGRLALMLACAGGAIDLLCDCIHITVLPLIASWGTSEERLFLVVERIALAGGLVVANGLYSVSTLLLTICLRDLPGLSSWVLRLGYAVFACGMVLVAAGFANSAWLAELASGPTIGLFCVWTVLTAQSLKPAGMTNTNEGKT